MLNGFSVVLFSVALLPRMAPAQSESYYSRLNTFSMYAEYSNTSSHVEWGKALKRRLSAMGGSYARRFNAPHWFDWTPHASVFYEVEVAPVQFVQDPAQTFTVDWQSQVFVNTGRVVQNCAPFTYVDPLGQYSVHASCTTQWTYMGGASPVGFRVNLGPKHRLQPFVDSHLGFLVARRDEPVDDSMRFNFTFEFGGGVELYRKNGTSVALEYRLHHFSNDYLGGLNPGVDNQIVKFTYSFGGRLRR